MKQLATIQTIKSLDPIPEKDRIFLASFEKVDWKVIVGKEDFKVGDKCVYIEYDSVLPQKPEFEFLRARCWSEKWQGFRIRNMKMGTVFSQGIAFPLSILTDQYPLHVLSEGIDVTEQLDIVKYDPEALEEAKLIEQHKKYGLFMRFLLRIPFIKNFLYPTKKRRGNWPEWAHKSDETRVQILPYVYETYKGVNVYVTEKLDGQSSLFGMVSGKFTVCSRNINLPIPSKIKGKYTVEKSKYWQTAEKFNIEKKLRKANKELKIDLYIQGEQCGPAIQDNKLALPELRFFLYNIFDITHQRYYNFNETVEFCTIYGFEMVPLIAIKKFDWENIDQILKYSTGSSYFNTNIPREGIVVRSVENMSPGLWMANIMSFKVVNPDFELMFYKKE